MNTGDPKTIIIRRKKHEKVYRLNMIKRKEDQTKSITRKTQGFLVAFSIGCVLYGAVVSFAVITDISLFPGLFPTLASIYVITPATSLAVGIISRSLNFPFSICLLCGTLCSAEMLAVIFLEYCLCGMITEFTPDFFLVYFAVILLICLAGFGIASGIHLIIRNKQKGDGLT